MLRLRVGLRQNLQPDPSIRVDVFAPSVDIWAIDTSNRYNSPNYSYPVLGSGYIQSTNNAGGNGTSLASAFVSGTLALAGEAFPWESGRELADRARSCVDHPAGTNLSTACLSGGRINAANALASRTLLTNASTRAWVGTGNNASIVGLTVIGHQNKLVAFQAMGPRLTALGVQGPTLQNPELQLYSQSGTLLVDARPGSFANYAGLQTGSPPSYAAGDISFAVYLSPNTSYTVRLVGSDGGTGQGLNAIYDCDNTQETASQSRLTNASLRCYTGRGTDGVWYPGIFGLASSGSGNQRGLIIESLGPSLAAVDPAEYNAGNILQNPSFTLDASGSPVSMAWASSNVWGLASTPNALKNRANNASNGVGGSYVDCDLTYNMPASTTMTATIGGQSQSQSGGALIQVFEF